MRRLIHRPRRLRRSPALRNLVRETQLSVHDFVLPLFVNEKLDERRPIASMQGVSQLPLKQIADEACRAHDLGLQAVLLFGIPEHKDEQASGAYAENGIVQKALRAIKSKCPDLVTITDACGFDQTGIMSYAAKFASAFYGPFREAAESPPQFGDRCSYQMDYANADEALREVALDIEEGADIVMVKPALPYIDILWQVHEHFGKPTAVYHVSGEYAMVKAAAEKGIVDERAAVLEIMTALKRAGADVIITYWARELARLLRE